MGPLQLLKSLSFTSPFTCTGESRDQFIQSYLYTELSHICPSKQQLSVQIRSENKTKKSLRVTHVTCSIG